MAKIKFDYTTAIPLQTLGCELDPVAIINMETLTLTCKYYERTIRTDTNQESTAYDRPVSFDIKLTQEVLSQMMQAVIPLAIQQEVLRMATPVIDVPQDPAPEPPPPDTTPTPTVAVTPSLATLAPGATLALNGTVTDPPQDATLFWYCPDAPLAVDSSTGVFTAPATPGDYAVYAKLVTMPDIKGVTIITVEAV